MKVYWVVAWDQYYPSSGLGNVKSTHATRGEADEAAAKLKASNLYPDYVEVIDVSDMLK